MANRDFRKIERIMKDFSQNIGDSGSGSGGMAMVNTLPEVGREDTLYKLPNGNVYSWSRVVEKELIPVYKPVKVGDVVTLKNEIGVEDLVTFTGTGEKTNIDATISDWTQEPGERTVYHFVREQRSSLGHPSTYNVWFTFSNLGDPENAGYSWSSDQSPQEPVSLTKSNIPPLIRKVSFEITQDFVEVLESCNVEINDLAFMFENLEIDHYETVEHVVFEGYTKLNGSYLIDMSKVNGGVITLDDLYYDAQEIYSNILMGAEVTVLYTKGNTMNIKKIDHVDVYRDAWERMLDVPQMKLYSSDGTLHIQIVLYSNYLDTLTGQQLIDDFGIWNESGYMGCSAVLGEPQVTEEQASEIMEVPVKDGKFASMLEGLIYLTSVKSGEQYEIRYTDTTRKDSKDLLLGTVSDLNMETIFRSLGTSEVLVSGEPINGSINLTKEYKVSTIIELSNGTQITCKFNVAALEDCFQPNSYAPSVVKGKFFNDIIGVDFPEDATVSVRTANVFNFIGDYLANEGIPDEPLSSGIIVKMFGEELQYRLNFISGEDDWSTIYASWKNSSETKLGEEQQDFTYNADWSSVRIIDVPNEFDETKDYSTSLIATLSDGSTIEVPTTMQFWEYLFDINWPA